MVELYEFQKDAVEQLKQGKHIITADVGTGKSFMMFAYLQYLNPEKVLIVALPSKLKSKDFERDADALCGEQWRKERTVEFVSWYKLYDWVYKDHWDDLSDWTVAYDENHLAAAGISSRMGKAFLALSQKCKNWTGYTATPGDTWIKFYPYFTASGLVRNKTTFMREFVVQQTYPFPMIKGYLHEDKLLEMWRSISYTPDASEVFAQMPRKTHQLVRLKKPRGYDKCLKHSETLEGEFLESNMALAHYIRQLCATKEKQEWLKDWLASTNESVVIFYNYTKEREDILSTLGKRKVWRIDGQKHEIPNADTIGKGDVVLVHYQSGSASLNLQFIRYWISYSYTYSYTTFKQALGRIDRIGQDRPMTFYLLYCCDTIEEDIAKCLKNKKDFSERVWAEEHGPTSKKS